MQISVIIPTLNEEGNIEKTLLSANTADEIIVVDCGSRDNTVQIAKSFGAKVIFSEKGRGIQMDAGAGLASGDVILFLHADTILPSGWKDYVEKLFNNDNIIGGAFLLGIDSKKLFLKLINWIANLRAKFLGLIFGDQTIFVRRDAFYKIGGFRGLPIMEDIDFVRRLKKTGKVELIKEKVLTSERRWEKKGILTTTIDNHFLLFMYYLGYSPERLYRLYYKDRP